MKKAFDQTIRDIKREVNKKVLKVPSIEQKVLDATSNEPWGPHGTLLADIAQATRNYHEYPIVMSVMWKRINDTGKNWRHVYKALTVLEYLVAHGSERVIDEIREHAYQISTLSDFQYIDSSGRDQGNNVRRKSQSLVHLVNDKERIQEVRQKAASNKDKFRSPSAGGMYRPSPYSGSGGYGDDRYDFNGRDDERNGYGRERDDDRYGRYGDGYNKRDSEEYYDRDSYRDDDSRGRRSFDGDQYGSRCRSSDKYGDRVYDDDDSRSSRGSSVRGGRAQDGRSLQRKYSEQNLSVPPSYEEAVGDSGSPAHSERSGETTAASAPQSSSPIANAAQSFPPTASAAPQSSSSTVSINPSHATAEHRVSSLPIVEGDPFDEFDPRSSFPAAPSTSNNAEMDLLGSLSEVLAPNPLASLPVSSGTANMEADTVKTAAPTFAAATSDLNQSFEDPFGDTPFKAISTDGAPAQPQDFTSMSSFQPAVSTFEPTPPVAQKAETANPDFPDAFPSLTVDPKNIPTAQTVQNPQFLPQEPQLMQENDILAGILPPPGSLASTASQVAAIPSSTGLPPAMGSQTAYPSMTGFMPQAVPTDTPFGMQKMALPSGQHTHQHSLPYSSVGFQARTGTFSHQQNNFLADILPQGGPTVSPSAQSAFSSSSSSSADSLALVPQQPAKQKFEPKSAVWTDTLNRGLVNLDISGPKTNPMAELGIDFESLNRKEKRTEKPSSSVPTTSNVSMGKAMGSGTGMGRARAGALRPSVNPMMGSGMGMGMGTGTGMGMGNGVGVDSIGQQPMGMGMGGYGPMGQQPMSMGGMGVGMGMGMGGMNMGMGRGAPMQPPNNGLAPGSNMNNYNPMMGRGGYPQQPYGGGY